MSLISELRIRARHVLFPAAGVAAVVYFVWLCCSTAIAASSPGTGWRRGGVARSVSTGCAARRETLERRVRLLYPQSLDPDMCWMNRRAAC
ncbi:MAG: hypothetical protein U1E33_05875 [Rhodospirillales bacterium]